MDTTETYSIRDLERISGIKAHTIRIWEKRYNLISPLRTSTNIRFYTNEHLKLLLNVSLLSRHGLKISAISGMTTSDISEQVQSILSEETRQENWSDNLLLSLIEINELVFNRTFRAMEKQLGFEQAFIQVVFPFFDRIGIMWHAGSINPAQEHFFSNMVRQKLISATDAFPPGEEKAGKKALLFLPEHELHELALLFYNYALRSRGYHTIYLGQSVPLDSLNSTIRTCNPDLIVTGMTNAISPIDLQLFAATLARALPDKPVYITGSVAMQERSSLPQNVRGIDSFLELLQC
ncbi:MerR family transcriptional regulator [Arcticibacter sp. MXS-1]|uniref:MerR family transcriptional regulator n=1 Tax=Arcticibacter sp. MXS-1 TaxID=3341726 RepID=UPI0035A946A2